MKLTRVLTLTLALGCAVAAMATPNFLGPTGLLLTPSDEALTKDQYNASINKFENVDDVEYAFNYGIRENIEVGFTRLPDAGTTINAKYNFKPETDRTAGLALGIMDLTDNSNLTLYAVAGKTFNFGELEGVNNFRGTLGIAGGDESMGSLSGLFAGLTFDVAKRATVMVEYDSENLNYGLKVPLTQEFVAQAGFVGDDSNFTFGASYNSKF